MSQLPMYMVETAIDFEDNVGSQNPTDLKPPPQNIDPIACNRLCLSILRLPTSSLGQRRNQSGCMLRLVQVIARLVRVPHQTWLRDASCITLENFRCMGTM